MRFRDGWLVAMLAASAACAASSPDLVQERIDSLKARVEGVHARLTAAIAQAASIQDEGRKTVALTRLVKLTDAWVLEGMLVVMNGAVPRHADFDRDDRNLDWIEQSLADVERSLLNSGATPAGS
jgi:hypothetical protein